MTINQSSTPARRGRKSQLHIVLTAEERRGLEHALRQTTLPAGRARRARAILLKADGHLVSDIAPLVGLSRRHVYKWLWAFRDDGLQGLRLTTRGWRRLAGCVVLALLPLGCVPPPGSGVARTVEKLWGVPTPEEQAFCRLMQEYYLKQAPPQLPPSCTDLVKAQREKAGQP